MFDAGAIVGSMRLGITDWTRGVSRVKSDSVGLGATLEKLKGQSLAIGLALGTAGAAVTAFMGKSVTAAMRVQEAENLFEVSMGNMAASTRAWSEDLALAIGMNANTIREGVGTFNVMLGSMGLAEQSAATMSKEFTKLAYDMASFYNLDPTMAFDKLRAGLSGEAEPLKRLGILVNETTTELWALEHGLIASGEKMNEQQKVVARFGSIMEQTTKAQGDMARTGGSATNQWRRLTEQVLSLTHTIGGGLLPTITEYLGKANVIVSAGIRWISANDELAASIAKVVAAAGLAVSGLGAFVLAAPGIVAAAKIVSLSFVAMWTAATGPVGLIVGGLAAVGVALYTLRATWNANFLGMQTTTRYFASTVKSTFDGMFVPVQNFLREFSAGWNATMGSAAEIVKGLGNSILSVFDPANYDIRNLYKGIFGTDAEKRAVLDIARRDYISYYQETGTEVAKSLFDRFKAGATAGLGVVKNEVWPSFIQALKTQAGSDWASIAEWIKGVTPDFSKMLVGPDFEGYKPFEVTELMAGARGATDAISGTKKAASEAEKAIEQMQARMESMADAGRSMWRSMVPQEDITFQVVESLQNLKAAGLVDESTPNLLGSYMWERFQNVSGAAMDAAISKLYQLGGVAAEVGQSMRDTMASEWIVDVASQVGGWFDGTQQKVEQTKASIGESISELGARINGIGDSIRSNVATNLGAAVSSLGSFTQSLETARKAFKALKDVGGDSASNVLSSVLGMTSGVLGAVGAVASLGQAFGLFGEESVEELKGIDKMMEELGDKLDEWADRLTDTIVDFVKTGKASFREFVDSVLEDMLQLSIHNLVVGPVFDAIGGAFAKGGAYTSQGIIPLAKGHVTNGPEFFTSGGKRYVRGEAGQEGVVPLRRMGNGDLGVQALTGGGGGEVQVIVNDYRTSGEAVQVSEQSGPDGKRQILVTIRDAIAELAGDGQLDRIMSTNWRLRRQPV